MVLSNLWFTSLSRKHRNMVTKLLVRWSDDASNNKYCAKLFARDRFATRYRVPWVFAEENEALTWIIVVGSKRYEVSADGKVRR